MFNFLKNRSSKNRKKDKYENLDMEKFIIFINGRIKNKEIHYILMEKIFIFKKGEIHFI